MNEYKYKVIADGNRLLAICDSLDNAIIFLRGYMTEYYAEPILSVSIERSEGSIHGEIIANNDYEGKCSYCKYADKATDEAPCNSCVEVHKTNFDSKFEPNYVNNTKNYNRCDSCVHTAVGYDMSPCSECKEIHHTMPESKYEPLDDIECDVK